MKISGKSVTTISHLSRENYYSRQGVGVEKLHGNLPVYGHNIYNMLNPIALRKAKIVYNFGLSECNRVKANRSFLPAILNLRSEWTN